ncbi:MAG: response regulator [Candidatus Aenigmarchaeota archaeon]|nr:response regulator [Candidatus Aenigmarchaeota archaeon]
MRVVACVDLYFQAKIDGIAKYVNSRVTFCNEHDLVEKAKEAQLAVIDLETFPGTIAMVPSLKARGAQVIGFLSHANTELRQQAQQAGCMVVSRAFFSERLAEILKE